MYPFPRMYVNSDHIVILLSNIIVKISDFHSMNGYAPHLPKYFMALFLHPVFYMITLRANRIKHDPLLFNILSVFSDLLLLRLQLRGYETQLVT